MGLQYQVVCTKSAAERWGLDLILPEVKRTRPLQVAAVKEGCFFYRWNEQHPDKPVSPGARLLQVNGFSGHHDIVKQFQTCQTLRILISRYNLGQDAGQQGPLQKNSEADPGRQVEANADSPPE